MKKFLILLTLSSSLAFSGCDILLPLLEAGTGSLEPTNTEIIAGLKEALGNGAAFAVSTLNKEGGYYNDPLVKIPFPQEAMFVANKLREFGLGELVDNFEQRLNEGAEKVAKMALPIFKDAITSMSFADAKQILFGGENAATSYFQAKTSGALITAFAPHIKSSLDEVNATELWTKITTNYNRLVILGGGKEIETDLVKYATDRALSGLFLKLADEEKKIREQPVARTSEILKKVFGYAQTQTGNQ